MTAIKTVDLTIKVQKKTFITVIFISPRKRQCLCQGLGKALVPPVITLELAAETELVLMMGNKMRSHKEHTRLALDTHSMLCFSPLSGEDGVVERTSPQCAVEAGLLSPGEDQHCRITIAQIGRAHV